MRCLTDERDHGALQRSHERKRNRPDGWAGGNRAGSAACADQASTEPDERFRDPLDLAPERMILAGELEPQRHRDAGEVAPAIDGMTLRQRDQRRDRIGLLLDQPTDLVPPRFVDPREHRAGQILLALELVIQGPTRVTGLASDLFEHEVAIAVAREASRGRLEQGAPGAGAARGLSRARENIDTYMHVCIVPDMKLPSTAHTSRPWRIHELTGDFELEDVWELPTPGGPDDFPRLVQRIVSSDPSRGSRPTRALWAIRWKLGSLLGLDGPDSGLGSRVTTLRHRLPQDLREAPSGPDFAGLPFTSLYLLDDEFAAEIANRTMHGVMHLGWVQDGTGRYHGQMAVLVKPNGLLGSAYMAAIKPVRHLLVYPAMLRRMERDWRTRAATPTHA